MGLDKEIDAGKLAIEKEDCVNAAHRLLDDKVKSIMRFANKAFDSSKLNEDAVAVVKDALEFGINDAFKAQQRISSNTFKRNLNTVESVKKVKKEVSEDSASFLVDLKDEIEGCCFEIQQSILPKLRANKDAMDIKEVREMIDRIDGEAGAIDGLMTELGDRIDNGDFDR